MAHLVFASGCGPADVDEQIFGPDATDVFPARKPATPTVAISSPAAGSYVTERNQAAFVLGGTCSEVGRVVALSGAGTASVPCSSVKTWTATFDLSAVADGTLTFVANHQNSAGTKAAPSSRSFVKDTFAPTVEITSPAAGSYVNRANASAFGVSGTCSENGRTVNLSGAATSSAACNSGSWSASINLTAAQDGVVTLQVDLSDAAGNSAVQASIELLKDATDATVAIASPDAGTVITTETQAAFTIAGTCSEVGRDVAISGAASATLPCDATNTWAYTFDLTAAPEGSLLITVDHQDAAANAATDSRSFIKQTVTPPPNAGPVPTIPAPTGSCPALVAGDVTFAPAGVSPRSVRLWISPTAAATLDGPIVFYWYGIYGNPGDAITGLSQATIDAITAAGGIVAAPYHDPSAGLLPWFLSNGSTRHDDLRVADEVLACAAQQVGADLRHIHSLGFSAGGLHTAQMSYLRSNYLASVVTYSGGLNRAAPVALDPTNRFPALIFYGGSSDTVWPYNFQTTSQNYKNDLRAKGQLAIVCNHNGGHAIPTDAAPSVWQYFQDHPYRAEPSPYADGLPVDFTSYCAIAP